LNYTRTMKSLQLVFSQGVLYPKFLQKWQEYQKVTSTTGCMLKREKAIMAGKMF